MSSEQLEPIDSSDRFSPRSLHRHVGRSVSSRSSLDLEHRKFIQVIKKKKTPTKESVCSSIPS